MQAAIELRPNQLEAYMTLAFIHERAHRHDMARKVYDLALANNPADVERRQIIQHARKKLPP